MANHETEDSASIESADLPKPLINCLIFIEDKANLKIKGPVILETVIPNEKNVFTISASSFTVTQLESNQQFNCLNSDHWIIFLGSSHQEYQLFVKSHDNSYELNVGNGPTLLIDCTHGQHFAFNGWTLGQQFDSSEHESGQCRIKGPDDWQTIALENRVKDISLSDINRNTREKPLIYCDQLLTDLTFNPIEVIERLRQYSRQHFGETDEAKKEILSQKLNQYLPDVIPKLCKRLNSEILDKEPRVVFVQSPSFAFGDIHGNLQDLYDYENLFWKSGKKSLEDSNYLFLGDYVDRGQHSVEVSVYLFLLKLIKPGSFILIRGNHEVRSINKSFTFYKECHKKYGNVVGSQIWDQINQCFERLPIAAVVDEGVFCCHGGVPKSITTLADIQSIPKPLVQPDVESPGAHELMWNDPIDSMTTFNRRTSQLLKEKNVGFIVNRRRSTGFYYTELAVDHFFDVNNLTYLIRGHENVKQGFKFHFGGKVVTVFSSSHYAATNNSTACIKITSDQIQPVIIKLASDHTN